MSKRKSKTMNNKRLILDVIYLVLIICATYIFNNVMNETDAVYNNEISNNISTGIGIEEIPEYTDKIYIEINNNKPYFEEKEYTTEPFEKYSELDELKRCGTAYANICKEIMPLKQEERGDISQVKPTGWKQTKVEGGFLYNRCHLIGYQLAGENANKQNLITGTRYFNVTGMLPFENQIAEYINKNTKNHVLYRVTPIYKDTNLLASGVEMEAYSVEDNGSGVCYNVFVYNVQPGVNINYATGEAK